MRLRFLFFQSHRFKTRCHGPRSGLDISVSSVSWVADYLSDTAPLGAPCVLWWLQGKPTREFPVANYVWSANLRLYKSSHLQEDPNDHAAAMGNRDGQESGHGELVQNFVEWMKRNPLLDVTKTKKMVDFMMVS